MSIKVEIVTPTRKAFQGEVSELQAPGWFGEFGVLPRHAAMLTLVRAGVLTLHNVQGQLLVDKEPEDLSGKRRLVLGAGFAEVGPTGVTLMVDLCEDAAKVDKAKAAEDLKAASAKLGTVDPASADGRLAQKAADLARARLAV